jgi:hypothetical protein
MRLFEFDVLHSIIESFEFLIHSLIDLAHLDLNVCLVYLLSLDTIIVLDPRRCVLGALVTHLMAMLGSLTSDTLIQLVLQLLLKAIVHDKSINMRSKGLDTLD